jgi:hypothetical protein
MSYAEWERLGRSSPAGLVVGALEFVLAATLLVALWRSPWSVLIVPAVLGSDYLVRSALANRGLGPVAHPRGPLRALTIREWSVRQRERRGLLALGVVFVTSVAVTGVGPIAFAALPFLYAADYAWCCATSGSWLASPPPPPMAG